MSPQHRALAGVALALCLASAGREARAQATGDNGWYRISLRREGEYTVGTSTSHPGGPGVNVFYGGRWNDSLAPIVAQLPGSTRNTLRSYDTNTEYIFRQANTIPSPGFQCETGHFYFPATLDLIPTGSPSPTGAQLTWQLRNGADDLTVTQEVNAEGSTAADARVRVTVCVRNNSAAQAHLGLRFLWDWCVGPGAPTSPPPAPSAAQDGPWIGLRPPDPPLEPFIGQETEWRNPAFDSYQASDSDSPSISAPTLLVGSTVNAAPWSPAPTPPDLIRYSTWDNIRATCFESAITPEAAGGVDSVVALFWGDTRANAKVMASGETWCVTQYVIGSFTPPPPTCRVTARLTGGSACETALVVLDASGTTSANCASGVIEYQFRDPFGAIARPWGLLDSYQATEEGTWSVEARCQGEPSCTSTASAPVSIEVPPSPFQVTATDQSACSLGILVEWPADWAGTAWGTNGAGTFTLYRSTLSCADALAGPPIAFGITDTSHLDQLTAPGSTYHYAVRAEAFAPAEACPPGPERSAPFAESCVAAPVTELAAGAAPAPIGGALRLRKTASQAPELRWATAPALGPGESDVVVSCALDRAARTETTTDLVTGLSSPTWTHDPAPGTPLYYRVFRENACGDRSDD